VKTGSANSAKISVKISQNLNIFILIAMLSLLVLWPLLWFLFEGSRYIWCEGFPRSAMGGWSSSSCYWEVGLPG